jgi:hypothetical protein
VSSAAIDDDIKQGKRLTTSWRVFANHSETVGERPVFGALSPFMGKSGGLQGVQPV